MPPTSEAPESAQQQKQPSDAENPTSSQPAANPEALEYVPAKSAEQKQDQSASNVPPAQPEADKSSEPAKSGDVEMTPAPAHEAETAQAQKESPPHLKEEPDAKEEKKDVEMSTDSPPKSPLDASEKSAENVAEASKEQLPESPTESGADKPAEKHTDVPTETPKDEASEKREDKSLEEPGEKPDEKTDEKAVTPMPENPEEPAEEPANGPSEKLTADDNADDKTQSPVTSRKRSRRALVKLSIASPTRTLRPRSSSRNASAEASVARPRTQNDEDYLNIPAQSTPKSESLSAAKSEPDLPGEGAADENEMEDDTPRPVQTEKGLRMTVGDSVFVTFDQLEPIKQQRMHGKNLKPIEELTFRDILSYNRDQLRCYCYIYSTPRKKKSEMEVDMARFVSLWNEGRPGFVFSEYVPKNFGRMNTETSPGATYSANRDRADGSARTSRRSTPTSSKAASASMGLDKPDVAAFSADQLSQTGPSATGPVTGSTPGKAAIPSAAATPKSSTKTPSRPLSRAPSSAIPTASAKRPPPRPTNIQPSPVRPNLPPRAPSSERPLAPGRSSGGMILPNNTPFTPQGSGSGSGRNSSGSSSKSARPIMPVQSMPQGFGTSHKQKVHARTAGAKFKAAYNGAGPALVNIVENAAAYFEGKDSPEVILDRTRSYERYQFNVDLLTEIFDGPSSEAEHQDQGGDVAMSDVDAGDPKAAVTIELAKRMRSRAKGETGHEMKAWEENYLKLEKRSKEGDRTNMRLFQRLERAETEDEIDTIKRDFERENDIRLPCAPPPLVRRKLDKSLPPVLMPDDKCHILRFKVA